MHEKWGDSEQRAAEREGRRVVFDTHFRSFVLYADEGHPLTSKLNTVSSKRNDLLRYFFLLSRIFGRVVSCSLALHISPGLTQQQYKKTNLSRRVGLI